MLDQNQLTDCQKRQSMLHFEYILQKRFKGQNSAILFTRKEQLQVILPQICLWVNGASFLFPFVSAQYAVGSWCQNSMKPVLWKLQTIWTISLYYQYWNEMGLLGPGSTDISTVIHFLCVQGQFKPRKTRTTRKKQEKAIPWKTCHSIACHSVIAFASIMK